MDPVDSFLVIALAVHLLLALLTIPHIVDFPLISGVRKAGWIIATLMVPFIGSYAICQWLRFDRPSLRWSHGERPGFIGNDNDPRTHQGNLHMSHGASHHSSGGHDGGYGNDHGI